MALKRSVDSLGAREYLAFAQELMAVADACEAANRWRAAGLNSIHAAIAAADAVCAAFLGATSSAESHGEAAELLARSGAPDAQAKAVLFSAVIAKKAVFAYEARPPSREDAELLLKRTRRLVPWAVEVVRQKLA